MFTLITTILALLVGSFIIRLSVCLPQFRKKHRKPKKKVSTMIVFGSGGHTTEMLRLLVRLNADRYHPCHYVLSHSDTTSTDKIQSADLQVSKKAAWHKIYRSREVKQSYWTTLLTTARASIESVALIARIRPELIICNGPGTCVPICYSAFLMRLLGINEPTIIFVESFCRVKSLSITGKLLYPIADRFIVQWPELADKYSSAEYLGVIC